MGHSKLHYFNKRAQTITELAVFGSVMLMVLSFFVSYGMRFIHQQDVNMRSFRMALSEAYNRPNPGPDASAAVILAEDKHTPDPRDMVGRGSFVATEGIGDAVWGNSMEDHFNDPLDTPYTRIKFVINGQQKEYTTGGPMYWSDPFGQGFWTDIPGVGTVHKSFAAGDVRCYQADANSPRYPRIVVGTNTYVISSAAIIDPSLGGRMLQLVNFIASDENLNTGFTPATAANGDLITGFYLFNTQIGTMDPYYMNPEYVKENSDLNGDGIPDLASVDLQQGLIEPPPNITTQRNYSLKLDETATPGYYESTAADDYTTTITHEIRDNDLMIDTFPYTVSPGTRTTIWHTVK